MQIAVSQRQKANYETMQNETGPTNFDRTLYTILNYE